MEVPRPAVPVAHCVPRDMVIGVSKTQFPSLTGILIPASSTSQDCGEDGSEAECSQNAVSQGPDNSVLKETRNMPGLPGPQPRSTADPLSTAAFAQSAGWSFTRDFTTCKQKLMAWAFSILFTI